VISYFILALVPENHCFACGILYFSARHVQILISVLYRCMFTYSGITLITVYTGAKDELILTLQVTVEMSTGIVVAG